MCGCAQSQPRSLERGTVTEVTAGAHGTHISTIKCDAGPVIIARLVGTAQPGQAVELRDDGRGGISAVGVKA